MLPEQIGYLVIIIGTIGTFFYVKDIIKGTTKPNRVSWTLWMLASFTGGFLQFKAGAGFSALPAIMAGFSSLTVLIFSLFVKNAYWKITVFDIFCGFLSLFALILFVITHKFGISILFALISDFLACIPSLTKSWNFPETETGIEYILSALNGFIGLLVLKTWVFLGYSFGLYFVILNLVFVFFIYRKKISSFFR